MTNEDIEFIKDLTISYIDDEMRNSDIFGDEDTYNFARKVNSLEQWEKNLLFLYLKYGSVKKLEQILDVKYGLVYSVLKDIKTKLRQ